MTSDKTLNTPYGQGSVRQMHIKRAQLPDLSNTSPVSSRFPFVPTDTRWKILRPLHLYSNMSAR